MGDAAPVVPQGANEDAIPFGLPKRFWDNVDGLTKIVGVLPLLVGAYLYWDDTPDRNAAYVRDAWKAVMTRPIVEERDALSGVAVKRLARNWGAVPALETLVRKGERLHSIDLEGADLSNAHLFTAQLAWSGLRGVSFFQADLVWADLRCSDLRGADFRGAQLFATKFDGANISGATFDANAAGLAEVLRAGCRYPEDGDYGVIIAPKGWESHNPTLAAQIPVSISRCGPKPDPETGEDARLRIQRNRWGRSVGSEAKRPSSFAASDARRRS
jgi:hypothetical protein